MSGSSIVQELREWLAGRGFGFLLAQLIAKLDELEAKYAEPDRPCPACGYSMVQIPFYLCIQGGCIDGPFSTAAPAILAGQEAKECA